MDNAQERRFESRLAYHWPIWYADTGSEEVAQGQMIDVSSQAASFACCDGFIPYEDQWVTARFSVPRYGEDQSFQLMDIVRTGHILRIEQISANRNRVVMQFHQCLDFKPGEQGSESASGLIPITSKHGADIMPGGSVFWNIDYKQMGLGGDTSWGRPVHKEYRIPAGEYTYSFWLIPFDRKVDDPVELARTRIN